MPSAAQVWKALLVGFVVAATAAAWLVDQETSDRHRVASTLLVLVTAWILAWACAALVRTRRTETRRGRVVAWCLLVAAVVVGACGVLATAGDPRQGDSLWLLGIALGLAAIGAFAVVAVRRDWFRPRKARVALAAIVGFALAACLLALAQWRVPSEPLDGAGFRTTTSSSTTSTTAADADHDVQRGTDLCDLGARLAEAGLDDQARAAYTRALRTDRSNYECAYDGLDELAPDPPPPPDAGSVLDRMGTNLRRIGGATLDLFALEPLTRLRWGIGETFVLLALLALLLRTIRRRSKLRRPAVDIVAPTGTIEEDEPDKDALAAVLRDALATAGVLPASTVPGGALGAEVEAVVTQNPLADKVGLAKIGSFLAGIIDPKVGYKVESTIRNRSGEDPAGLTVEATDLRSGTKRFISTVWAATHTAAAEAAAYRVIAEVSALAPEPPEWRRWRSLDGEGIQRYFSALALQRAGDLTGARAAALEAVASEPRNARVRLTLAEIDEHGGAWLEAIESYAAVLAEYRQDETFPSSNIRYRLATAMSYVEDWKDDWAELVLPRREALQQLLVVAGVLPDPSVLPVAKDDLVEEFLAVAEAIYTEHPASGWEDDVDPLDPATVAMAKSCTELQRLQAAGDDLDDRKLLVAAAMKNVPLPGRAPAGARYNAACLLARRLRDSDVQGSASTRRQLARQAVEQLQAAVRDPKGELDRQRLHYLFESDPDLEPLRREPAFLAWRARLQGQWPPLLSATAEALSDELLDLAAWTQCWAGWLSDSSSSGAIAWRRRLRSERSTTRSRCAGGHRSSGCGRSSRPRSRRLGLRSNRWTRLRAEPSGRWSTQSPAPNSRSRPSRSPPRRSRRSSARRSRACARS